MLVSREPAGAAPQAVAVDLGGHSVRISSADGSGRLRGRVVRERVSRESTQEEIVGAIGAGARAVVSGAPSVLVAAIPSFMFPDGTMAECPSLPALTGSRFGDLLAGATGAERVEVVPDLAAATLAEQQLGTGRQSARFICVTLGTGANAGAVVDGRPVETAFGCLGDAGHVLVDPDGPECSCGGRGCLESITSGWALARDGATMGWASAAEVTSAAERGDVSAIALLSRAGVMLGRACATWSAMLWPDTIAVAGGVAGAGELLLGPARREMRRVGAPYIVSEIELRAATLGSEATLSGAALLSVQGSPRPTPHA